MDVNIHGGDNIQAEVDMKPTPMKVLGYEPVQAACDVIARFLATSSPINSIHDVEASEVNIGRMSESNYGDAVLRSAGIGSSFAGFPAAYDNRRDSWEVSAEPEPLRQSLPQDPTDTGEGMLETENYREAREGLFMKFRNGAEKKVSNIRIRISRKVLRYCSQDDIRECYAVEVYSDGWDTPRILDAIPKEKMKDIFDLIRREFGDAFILTNVHEVLELYRTDVFRKSMESWEIVKVAARRGWINMDGTISYAPGDDDYYRSAPIPEVRDFTIEERRRIFMEGSRFLDVGRRGATIAAVVAFAHLGFSNFWLERIGIPCQFALFLHGETGSGKTQIGRAITNVFELERRKKNLRFSATDASFAEMVEMVQDACILVDDFSATQSDVQRDAIRKLEKHLRVAGDRDLPAKMRHGRLHQSTLRSVILMTGETEAAGLAKSSALRAISVQLHKEEVDWSVLTSFQEDNERIKLYFAAYIAFLEAQMPSRLEEFRGKAKRLRAESSTLREARLRDAGIVFGLQGQLIRDFALWMGLTPEEASEAIAPFGKIEEILRDNARAARLLTAAERFLLAFQQVLNEYPGSLIAENEAEYAADEGAYVGFNDADTIWVHFEKAAGFIKKYYRQQGEEVVISPSQIKKQLCEAGILLANKNSKGTMDFVHRARKGSRKRMIVLYKAAIERKLELLNKEEEL